MSHGDLQQALEVFNRDSRLMPISELKKIEQNLLDVIIQSSPLPTSYEKSLVKMETKSRNRDSYIRQITSSTQRLCLLSQVIRLRNKDAIQRAIECLKNTTQAEAPLELK